ncbi:MAG: carbohydrate kinase [Planctomycetota bacterium]|nr:MAG: carbohydrate kinase [Planctomycetota bacterium]
MEDMADTIVVGLGEVLWDCFADARKPGGAPANVAFHAQQLGHRGVVCSRVGDDELGHELVDHIASCGLDVGYIQRDTDKKTGYVTVDTSNPARPVFTIHEDVAWDHIEFDERLERLMKEASAVCFGTLAQRNPASRETIASCLKAANHAFIVYDVNIRQSWYRHDWIEDSLLASHVAKLNIDEIEVLDKALQIGSVEPPAFADALQQRYDVDMVCITRAEDGCILIVGGEYVEAPGIEVEVSDAVGAGDAFTAALISARLRDWSLKTTADFANRVGALVAGQSGAMPPLADEFEAIVSQVQQ